MVTYDKPFHEERCCSAKKDLNVFITPLKSYEWCPILFAKKKGDFS
jgi:hypothetical protein